MEQRWPDSRFWRCRHEIITLDPMQRLQFIPVNQNQVRRLQTPTRLPAADLKRLAELCVQPLRASEVVARFKARNEPVRSDRQVLLALQDLIAGGVLVQANRA
jgi:hypothetical protein